MLSLSNTVLYNFSKQQLKQLFYSSISLQVMMDNVIVVEVTFGAGVAEPPTSDGDLEEPTMRESPDDSLRSEMVFEWIQKSDFENERMEKIVEENKKHLGRIVVKRRNDGNLKSIGEPLKKLKSFEEIEQPDSTDEEDSKESAKQENSKKRIEEMKKTSAEREELLGSEKGLEDIEEPVVKEALEESKDSVGPSVIVSDSGISDGNEQILAEITETAENNSAQAAAVKYKAVTALIGEAELQQLDFSPE